MTWAAGALLAAAAVEQPLVVVWDSLEWAGPSLLRLIGELRDALRDSPLLMICAGRPELAERDGIPWLQDRSGVDIIEVGALDPDDSSLLAASLTAIVHGPEVQSHAADVVDRVAVYGGGNPLFIRLLLESALPGEAAADHRGHGRRDDRPAARARTAAPGRGLGHRHHLRPRRARAAGRTGAGRRARHPARPAVDPPGRRRRRLLLRPATRARGRIRAARRRSRRLSWHRCLAQHDVSPEFRFGGRRARLLGDLRPNDPELPVLAGRAADALREAGTAALRQRDMPAAIALLERAFRMPVGPDGRRALTAIRLSDALLLSGDTHCAIEVAGAAEQSGGPDVLPCRVQRELLAGPADVFDDVVEKLRQNSGGACREQELARCQIRAASAFWRTAGSVRPSRRLGSAFFCAARRRRVGGGSVLAALSRSGSGRRRRSPNG